MVSVKTVARTVAPRFPSGAHSAISPMALPAGTYARTASRPFFVCEMATETQTVNYVEMVPYTETIQVPVAAPCP